MLEPLAPDALEFTWALPGETTWLGFSPFAQALVLALVIKATPGPVFAETLRRGVIGGFGPAFAVQFGSLLGTALWVVSVGLVGGLLAQGRFLQILLGLTGTGLLAILAGNRCRGPGTAPSLPAEMPEKARSPAVPRCRSATHGRWRLEPSVSSLTAMAPAHCFQQG